MRARIGPAAPPLLLLAPAVLCTAAFIVLPLLCMGIFSFWTQTRAGVVLRVFTLANWREYLGDPFYVSILVDTLRLAATTTALCALIGYPTAYAIYSTRGHLRSVMLGLILFAYSAGSVPRAFSWLVVLGDRGLVNQILFTVRDSNQPIPFLYNQSGVLIGMIHAMLPFVTLILLGSMMRVSAHLVPAARTLGASPWRAFAEIFLPLTRQGVLAAAMLVLVYSLGFYIVPAVLGGAPQTTIVMQIRELVLRLGIWGLGAALSSIVVLVSIVGAAFYVRATGLSDVYRRD